jgi:hypothetical protein
VPRQFVVSHPRAGGVAKQGKAPATADVIGKMLGLCPDNMIGKRDSALLAFGFAGAFRRSELCALEVADLTETLDGLMVRPRDCARRLLAACTVPGSRGRFGHQFAR